MYFLPFSARHSNFISYKLIAYFSETLTMIYTKSKFVKQPCQMQEFVSSRGIPREQPEIVRYYNNNYKGVDYVDQLTKILSFQDDVLVGPQGCLFILCKQYQLMGFL
ncbi:Hypothetical_protein [Hexamita inflata]|uniref:Hypothetical_protein n=1 Tax=Hexamita inflata TaxID=28002 RepID=A0AA86TPP6_9EUKA|nr:Hypothetical protein HINF_LOCUS9857 [Hexamita inflata]